MDFLSPEARSRVMKAIRSKDTQPELIVRRLLHRLGYRYRLHQAVVAGRHRPDIVFTRRRKVIYVHGCFWHRHQGCSRWRVPDSPYWREKLDGNEKRDRRNIDMLRECGWSSLVIWECELEDERKLVEGITRFLG